MSAAVHTCARVAPCDCPCACVVALLPTRSGWLCVRCGRHVFPDNWLTRIAVASADAMVAEARAKREETKPR